MGIWGIGAFENDDAMDWLYKLFEEDNASLLLEALERVAEHQRYLDASVCCRGIAAAEIVAAIKDRDSSNLPDMAKEWVSKQTHTVGGDIARLALRVIRRVRENSELRELWSKSESAVEWIDALAALEARLE